MRLKDEKGYSLVELLIVIAILAVVGGLICSILLSSTELFSRSKDEVDVQAEAQTTINWLNDMLAEAGYGVTYVEDATAHTLDIYNEANYYRVIYEIAEGKLYCEEREFQNDGSSIVLTSKQLLAEYVTDFSISTTTLTDDNPVVAVTLGMEKGERSVNLFRNVTLRNGVAINQTIEKVYEGKYVIVSSVQDVVVYPMESSHAKGTDVQFTARVTGIGFPSQMVEWSIADRTGLKDGTTIDANTGVLHIDENEETPSFVVRATSIDTDADGNRISSTATSGIVKVMTISSVQIVNPPTTAQAVGSTLQLTALVHGENMDEMGSAVSWSIPEEYKREGFSVDSTGLVSFGLGLYNAFPTDASKAGATVLVRATSVADPTKYADCVINLSFPDIDVDLDNLVYMLNRNGHLDLGEKMKAIGLHSNDFKLVWNLVNDGGLGEKVQLDTGTGVLSAEKDIDYSREYTLTVKVSAIMSGTQEVASTQNITVVVPKVTIGLAKDNLEIVKGTSDRVKFVVNGLNTTGTDVQVTSIPAVRNTLIYIQGDELVVSVGNDVATDQFDVKLSLIGHADIAKTGTIFVEEAAMSDDELATIINVEDIYLHVPVPGEEGRAPSLNEVKLEATTREINGYTIVYTYDWTRSRVNIQIGMDATCYFLKTVAGSDVRWYKANVTGENFYVPTPKDSDFPGFNGDEATLAYVGDTYTYKKYTYGLDNVYVVKSAETGKWYQYSGNSDTWIDATAVLERAHGATVTSSSDSSGYDDFLAVDGAYHTRWGSEYLDGEWIQIDLGSVYALDSVKLDWEGARAKDYDLMVSADGNTWTTIHITNIEDSASAWWGTRVNNGDNHFFDTIASSKFGTGQIPVRYVKMVGRSRQLGDYGYSLWEVCVYAKGFQP